jgi:hypothetical protein
MWQADNEIGLKEVAAKVRGYEARYGKRWALSPLLARLASSGGKLADAGAGKAKG